MSAGVRAAGEEAGSLPQTMSAGVRAAGEEARSLPQTMSAGVRAAGEEAWSLPETTSRRVLVTGADGFIGSALVRELERRGEEVLRYSLADGDISQGLPAFEGVRHVFHLAARTYVPESWQDPFAFYRVNVLGAAAALELCRRQGASITLMSTYVYGKPRYLPVDEDHPLDPHSPYNHSKILAEELGQFYAAKFGLHVSVLRPFNIYGPGQRPEFLIPTLLQQALAPDAAQIEVADLEPRRDYLYLSDLVEAILASVRSPHPFAVYNIGSGRSLSAGEVARAILAALGVDKPLRSRGERRPGEVLETVADITRARRELGWEPRVSFESGILKLIQR
jgi:nucleoside-diphosphate-sugar epimerase